MAACVSVRVCIRGNIWPLVFPSVCAFGVVFYWVYSELQLSLLSLFIHVSETGGRKKERVAPVPLMLKLQVRSLAPGSADVCIMFTEAR